jgi:glycosyltransferase involved in cell wall biosynthesis
MPLLATANSSNLPTISVITVVFNAKEEVSRTINSVLRQDYPNIEYIVIDGESIDGTMDVIRHHEDKLDMLVCERDEGIYDAMNKGVARAQGEWLVFMNAGDVFATPDALSRAVSVMNHGIDVVFSDWIYRETSEYVTADLGKLNVRHQSVIYRKSLHQTYGNYIVGKRVTISDYLFFLSIAHKKWAYCNSPIAICEKAGASSNPQHFYQRIAAELIFGKRSVLNCCGIFLLYPFYRFVKRNVLRIR